MNETSSGQNNALLRLFNLYVISFILPMLVLNDVVENRLLMYYYFLTHISNFFIFSAVNKEFRKEVENLMQMMMTKRRSDNAETVSSFQ